VRRDLDIQFKRIAQLQGELDVVKSEAVRAKGPAPRVVRQRLRSP
jgi:hypothetical protein